MQGFHGICPRSKCSFDGKRICRYFSATYRAFGKSRDHKRWIITLVQPH